MHILFIKELQYKIFTLLFLEISSLSKFSAREEFHMEK